MVLACFDIFEADMREGSMCVRGHFALGSDNASRMHEHCLIKYNPLYWLTLFVTVPFCVLGKRLHALIGQGRPVRDDETELETEARVVYVYGFDSFFVVFIVYELINAIVDAATGTSVESNVWTGLLIDLAIRAYASPMSCCAPARASPGATHRGSQKGASSP